MSIAMEKSNRKQCTAEEKKNKPIMMKKAIFLVNNMIDIKTQNIVDCLYTAKYDEIRKEIIKGILEEKNGQE